MNKKRSCNTSIFQSLLKSKDILSLEAQNHISSFISSQNHEDGGFKDRAAKPDLYYSVFGYTLSLIFGVKLNVRQEESYLNSIDKSRLDFIHAVCLIRAQFLLKLIGLQQKTGFSLKTELTEGFLGNLLIKKISKSIKKEYHSLFQILDSYQSEDKGYNHNRTQEKQSTVYANFLIWTLFDDLGYGENRLEEICGANQKLRLPNGSFANELNSKDGCKTRPIKALPERNVYPKRWL